MIPAYNEEKHIKEVVEKTKKYLPAEKIIVVDDGSKDNTFTEAKKTNVNVLRHLVNLGKGAALKTGCDYAIKKGAGAMIVLDSDMQHDPKEIPNFEKALTKSEMVLGYREKKDQMPFVLKAGNWAIDTTLSLLFGITVKDTQSGYRAFTKETYSRIRWKATDYSVESEMLALAGKHHVRLTQIPIETIYHDRYKGTGVLDGIAIVSKMVIWKLTR